MIDNKKIKTTESLQMRFSNEVKKKNIKNENTIIFLVFLLLM